MKNVKKNTMFFGAVVVALLMVSSVTAVNVPQVDESEELESEKIVDELVNYVYPDIYLSGQEELNILLEALDLLDFDDDPDFYLLLQGIVALMSSKGYVDSSDIEQIINDNDLEVGYISSGYIVTGDGNFDSWSGYCGGFVRCLRRPIRLPNSPIIGNVFFARVWWRTINNNIPIKITISGEVITYAHIGVAVGFTGFYHFDTGPRHWDACFYLEGDALLIRWRHMSTSAGIDDNCYSQSTPTQEQKQPADTPCTTAPEQNQLENNQPTNTPSSKQTTVFQQIKQLVQNIIINIKLRYQTTNI